MVTHPFRGQHSPDGFECSCGATFETQNAYAGHKASCDGPPELCEFGSDNEQCDYPPEFFVLYLQQIESPISKASGIDLTERYLCENHKSFVKEQTDSENGTLFYKYLQAD